MNKVIKICLKIDIKPLTNKEFISCFFILIFKDLRKILEEF